MNSQPVTAPQPTAAVIRLRCGTLTLHVEHAAMPLDELCTFGSRRNRKRGFLFISKVLGKHVPVRPSLMSRVHELLARQIADVKGPVIVVALAETAIGLGQGIFEELLRQTSRDDMLFLHSTRYRLSKPLALTFRESHSHATEHLIYFPTDRRCRSIFDTARTLLLVDDELTTGRTVAHLAHEFSKINPGIDSIRFVSITDWLDAERRRELADDFGRPVEFHQLLRGNFRFEANATFDPGPIPDVTGGGGLKDAWLCDNYGRLGVDGPIVIDGDRLERGADLRAGDRVLVLGTGEFAHAPFLFARHLQRRGWDVHFQSTTRSPILVGEGISCAQEFVDNYHDEIPNFVYNVAADRYDRILVGYETAPLPASHRLLDLLGAQPLFFGREAT